jgi:hypothetical protein
MLPIDDAVVLAEEPQRSASQDPDVSSGLEDVLHGPRGNEMRLEFRR